MTGPTPTRWRVLTWNVLGSRHPNIELLAEVIESYDPHIVALQEVHRHQAKHLAHRLGWHVRWARKHYPYSPLVFWKAEGLAVLSPSPLSHVLRTAISSGHPRWNYKHRVLLAVTVTRGPNAVRVYDTHLASHDADERIAQAHRIAEFVAQEQPPVAVVVGDLNAADEVEVIREFRAVGLVDPGGDSSSPAIAPHRRLDYILVPGCATITDRTTPEGGEQWHRLSDHLPVLVEFEV
ncbi:MAG: endonuclease/exonuclease/phosphatase family protein [Actinomycetota bacterium]